MPWGSNYMKEGGRAGPLSAGELLPMEVDLTHITEAAI